MNSKNPLGNGFTLPAGKLREPKSALKDADFILFNDCSKNFSTPKWIKKYKKPVLKTSYQIRNLVEFKSGSKFNNKFFRNKNVYLLSGIGNPASFEHSMNNLGIDFTKHFTFPDHYSYDFEKDIEPILKMFEDENINAIITTEKDYIKLKNIILNTENFFYAKLQIKVENFDIDNFTKNNQAHECSEKRRRKIFSVLEKISK